MATASVHKSTPHLQNPDLNQNSRKRSRSLEPDIDIDDDNKNNVNSADGAEQQQTPLTQAEKSKLKRLKQKDKRKRRRLIADAAAATVAGGAGGGDGIAEVEGVNAAIAEMDPSLLADYLARRVRKVHGEELSAVEVEDRGFSGMCFSLSVPSGLCFGFAFV